MFKVVLAVLFSVLLLETHALPVGNSGSGLVARSSALGSDEPTDSLTKRLLIDLSGLNLDANVLSKISKAQKEKGGHNYHGSSGKSNQNSLIDASGIDINANVLSGRSLEKRLLLDLSGLNLDANVLSKIQPTKGHKKTTSSYSHGSLIDASNIDVDANILSGRGLDKRLLLDLSGLNLDANVLSSTTSGQDSKTWDHTTSSSKKHGSLIDASGLDVNANILSGRDT